MAFVKQPDLLTEVFSIYMDFLKYSSENIMFIKIKRPILKKTKLTRNGHLHGNHFVSMTDSSFCSHHSEMKGMKQFFPLQCPAGVNFFQYSTSGWRHFSGHFPPVLQCNSFFLSPPFFPRRLQYVAVWIVCYYPAGDNIITTYLLSRVCKEWCCLGPQWSNNLTQGSRITHSWLGEVKHYQLERGVNKREVPSPIHPPLSTSLSREDRRGHTSSAPNGGCYSPAPW